MCEEAERVETIVDGDDDDVGRLRDPVVKRPVSGIAKYVAWMARGQSMKTIYITIK